MKENDRSKGNRHLTLVTVTTDCPYNPRVLLKTPLGVGVLHKSSRLRYGGGVEGGGWSEGGRLVHEPGVAATNGDARVAIR